MCVCVTQHMVCRGMYIYVHMAAFIIPSSTHSLSDLIRSRDVYLPVKSMVKLITPYGNLPTPCDSIQIKLCIM